MTGSNAGPDPDERCACHGKTEAELAQPYALFAWLLVVLPLIALMFAVVWR